MGVVGVGVIPSWDQQVAYSKSRSSWLFATPRHRLPLIRCTTFCTTSQRKMRYFP
jgi:hypothetical protein